jgi:uncharacterized protein (DUF1015 family)
MPDIKPFRGILYNQEAVELGDVVAPPYDVISPQQQAFLYEKSSYNIIRLILGRERDRYASAARCLEEWRQKEILIQDGQPCMYVLTQTFHVAGNEKNRRGFVAACHLEDIGKGSIFPHEKTLAKPIKDRLQLFQSTNALFSQIFGLYSDTKHLLGKYLDADLPVTGEVEYEGVVHRISRLNDPLAIASIAEYLKNQKVCIADGHHRYETALLYRDLQRLKNPRHSGREAYNFVPMYFTNMNDPGLHVLPTHRVLRNIVGFDAASFLEELKGYFQLSVEPSAEKLLTHLREKKTGAFGLVLPRSPRFLLLALKSFSTPFARRGPGKLPTLDVELLHSLILGEILKLSASSLQNDGNIDFEKDEAKVIQAVSQGEAQAAFLLNPTPVEKVRVAAESGKPMPQKSTFFFPKLLSGLLSYSFAD